MAFYTEDPIQGIGLSVLDAPVGFGEAVGAAAGQSFSTSITPLSIQNERLTEEEKGRSYYSRAFGVVQEAPETALLTREQAEQQVKDSGLEVDVPDGGMRQGSLDLLLSRRRAERERAILMQNAPGSSAPAMILASFASQMVDPINVAAAFIPIVGEVRYTSLLSQAVGGVGRFGIRFGRGAIEGAVGTAALEPAVYTLSQQLQDDYTITDSLTNIAFGAVLGGSLRSVGGTVYDRFRSAEPEAAPQVDTQQKTYNPLPDRQDGASSVVDQNGLEILHGSSRDDLSLDSIEIVRQSGQKQGKSGRVYGGFYGTSLDDIAQAEQYARMGDGSPTIYSIKIKEGTNILNKNGDITRLSETYINKLKEEGYGLVIGKDPRGRTEYVVIDKNAIQEFRKNGETAPDTKILRAANISEILRDAGIDDRESVNSKLTRSLSSATTDDSEFRKIAIDNLSPGFRAELEGVAAGRISNVADMRAELASLDKRIEAIPQEARDRAKSFQAEGMSRKEAERAARDSIASDLESTKARRSEVVDAVEGNRQSELARADIQRLELGEVPERFKDRINAETGRIAAGFTRTPIARALDEIPFADKSELFRNSIGAAFNGIEVTPKTFLDLKSPDATVRQAAIDHIKTAPRRTPREYVQASEKADADLKSAKDGQAFEDEQLLADEVSAKEVADQTGYNLADDAELKEAIAFEGEAQAYQNVYRANALCMLRG